MPGGDELVHDFRAGATVAIFTKVDDGNPATDKTRWLHKDHLGSLALVTDEAGEPAEARAFDPHGRPRATDWTTDPALLTTLEETRRGFTGHEHIDTLGLVHMNGRVYDPGIGRFLSADPFVQFPDTTQGFNRYAYVGNNPLSFTDPSGFFIAGFGAFAPAGFSFLRSNFAQLVASGQLPNAGGVTQPILAQAYPQFTIPISGKDVDDIFDTFPITVAEFQAEVQVNSIEDYLAFTRSLKDFGSSLSNGKFKNGAMTGAFSSIYGELAASREPSEAASAETFDPSGNLVPVQYRGDYHDEVANELYAWYRSQGWRVERELPITALTADGPVTAEPDFVIQPPGLAVALVEVKTGLDPQFTDNQRVVYPLALFDKHVFSSSGGIRTFGFEPDVPLPAFRVLT